MLYDIAHFWVALLLAAALGVAVGWFTRSNEPRHGPVLVIGRGWIFWGGVVFLVGLVLALLHALPDRPGLWLETALLLFVAYLVGCPLAALLPAGAGERPVAHRPPAPAPVRPHADEAVVSISAVESRPVAGRTVPSTMPAEPAAEPFATSGEAAAPIVVTPARSVVEPIARQVAVPGIEPVTAPGANMAPIPLAPARSVVEPMANPVSAATQGGIVSPTPVVPAKPPVEPAASPAAEPVATPGETLRPPLNRPTGIISDDPDAVDRPKR